MTANEKKNISPGVTERLEKQNIYGKISTEKYQENSSDLSQQRQ